MKVYELYVKIYCLHNVNKNDVSVQISKLIDSCLMEDNVTQIIHTNNEYKFYSFGALKPLEANGVYKKGNIYTFLLRTVDEKLLKIFRERLARQFTLTLKALTVETKEIKQRMIEKIFTLTPCVIKFDEGYWRNHYSADVFEKRIRENLIKKYNMLCDIKIDEEFELFQYIRFDNQKPVAFSCKGITLLGDKVTLGIANDQVAQLLTYMMIGTGLGEVNARGAGFIGYKFL